MSEYMDKVHLGDCLDILSNLPDNSVDMVLSDLPYGMTNCPWDTPIDLDKLWTAYRRVCKPDAAIVLFAQSPFDKVLGMSNIGWYRYEWIWEKSQATGHLNAAKMPMKAHENILVFYDKLPTYNPQRTSGHAPMHSYTKYVDTQNNTQIYGRMNKELSGGGSTDRMPRSVLRFPSDKQRNKILGVTHPTAKPVGLCEYLIRTYTNMCDVVLDNCIGMGNTAVAAMKTGRHFIGMEIVEGTYRDCLRRIDIYKNYRQ